MCQGEHSMAMFGHRTSENLVVIMFIEAVADLFSGTLSSSAYLWRMYSVLPQSTLKSIFSPCLTFKTPPFKIFNIAVSLSQLTLSLSASPLSPSILSLLRPQS